MCVVFDVMKIFKDCLRSIKLLQVCKKLNTREQCMCVAKVSLLMLNESNFDE